MTCLVPALLSLVLAQTSEAEKVARLERSLAAGQQQLEQLQKDQEAVAAEYQQSQAEFSALDQRLTKPSREPGPPSEEQRRERAALRSHWALARERFDLSIRQRKILQEKTDILKRKVAEDQAERDRFLSSTPGDEVAVLSTRIATLGDAIAIEEKVREVARAQCDLARRTRRTLDHEQCHAGEAVNEERESSDRLTDLQTELAALQAEQMVALKRAEESRKQADAASESSLSFVSVLHWLTGHGPNIVGIVLAVVVLRRLVRMGSRRIARLVVHGTALGRIDLEDRAETLARVFRGTASVAILIAGVLMLLEQFGVPVMPLMGGAAALGLAVAFGAQNLIKDYFTGFMVLLEDQYAVNDIIKVNNSMGGKVERITLRMTVLRDGSGVAHFIPHGVITTVSNLSHGWARAAVEVNVAYREDTDRVIDVLLDLCEELRRDPVFGPLIREDAEMLGVDQFAASGVAIKFVMKTGPQDQWRVKRELLRRIKRRFDELDIEIPFPTRMIHHREAA